MQVKSFGTLRKVSPPHSYRNHPELPMKWFRLPISKPDTSRRYSKQQAPRYLFLSRYNYKHGPSWWRTVFPSLHLCSFCRNRLRRSQTHAYCLSTNYAVDFSQLSVVNVRFLSLSRSIVCTSDIAPHFASVWCHPSYVGKVQYSTVNNNSRFPNG